MIRDSVGSSKYWNEGIEFQFYAVTRIENELKSPSGNPSYRPQYVFELAKEYWHLMLCIYSRGDSITELARYFPPMLDAWEESLNLGRDVFTQEQLYNRRAWKVNLDHYIVCFWLVGLALTLEIPDDQWQRLLLLVDNEGEDELLDRIIATRQPDRKIGTALCHAKPYQRLLKAVDAPSGKQPALLADFVKHWYAELDRPANKGNAPATAMYERPYWYTLGNRKLEDSGYFGRWCIEAVAAAKAFGLDDSLCLGHPNYPGDLLRSDGPTTHSSPEPETITPPATAEVSAKQGWLSRLLGKGMK